MNLLSAMLAAINPLAEPLKSKPLGGKLGYTNPMVIHGGHWVDPCKRYANGCQRNQRQRRLSGLKVGSNFVAPKPSSHAAKRKAARL